MKRRKGRESKRNGAYLKKEGVRRRTLSSALGVESPESSHIPWVRLESVIGCITQVVRSSGENFINNEGTLPLRFELVLLLLR